METDKILTVINQITVSKETQEVTTWKPTVNGEQDAFTEALKQRPLVKSTVENIKDVLKIGMLKVGLRGKNLPSDIERDILIDHLLSHYGNHTPAEIKLAFDLAVAGKLDDRNTKGEPIDLEVNCYENFSCLYLSKILNAYRRWARDNYTQLKKEQPLMIAEPKEIPPIEMIEWINEWSKKTDINVDLIPLCFYDFMVTTDMIEVSKQMKWDYWNKAIQAVKTELSMEIPACKTTDALKLFSEFETMEKDKMFSPKIHSRLENKSKKLIIFDYFRKK